MMRRRKLIFLFLAAMTFSVIIMVIIYGVFIKDIDFNFNVKNPESAPTPVDLGNEAKDQQTPDDALSTGEQQDLAKVKIPDDNAKKQQDAAKLDNQPGVKPEATMPQVKEGQAPTAQIDDNVDNEPPMPSFPEESTPGGNAPPAKPVKTQPSPSGAAPPSTSSSGGSLHYVYMDGFSSKEAALQAMQNLQGRNVSVQPYIRQHNGQTVLQFGVFSDKINAEQQAQQLRSQNVYTKVE